MCQLFTEEYVAGGSGRNSGVLSSVSVVSRVSSVSVSAVFWRLSLGRFAGDSISIANFRFFISSNIS